MRHLVLYLLAWIVPFWANAQTDTVPAAPAPVRPDISIHACRRELATAFEHNDRSETQFWFDSLLRLNDERYLSLYWDERWLLYLWLENYEPLFAEVGAYHSQFEELALYKIPPVKDSLFERLDTRLYAENLLLFDQVRRAWLNTEERAFGALLVTYLLRLNVEEPDKKAFDEQLDAFLKNYPTSRFSTFIRARMYNYAKPDDWGLGLDLMFLHGTWSGELERTLRPLNGMDIALYFWQNRVSGTVRFAVGGQKLERSVFQRPYEWPKGDPSTFLGGDLEIGYDVIHQPRLRIFPTVGGGYSGLRPPNNDEADQPDYYELFRYGGFHYQIALHADVRFSLGPGNLEGSYHGVRVRVGHRWLHLDRKNAAVGGNLFFVAVGYTIFGRQPQP